MVRSARIGISGPEDAQRRRRRGTQGIELTTSNGTHISPRFLLGVRCSFKLGIRAAERRTSAVSIAAPPSIAVPWQAGSGAISYDCCPRHGDQPYTDPISAPLTQ